MILIRHGRTAWNLAGRYQGWTDVPLDDVGRTQAHLLGQYLQREAPQLGPYALLASSDLSRARATAEAIGRAVDLDPVVFSDLRERKVGEWEGLTREEVVKHYGESLTCSKGELRPPGGETWGEVRLRVTACIRRLLRRIRSGESLLIVGHGGAWRMAIEGLAKKEGLVGQSVPVASLTVLEGPPWRVLLLGRRPFGD